VLEIVLIGLLIVQAVRLLWTIATPVGPLGEWRGRHAEILSPEMRLGLFRSFDAFYPAQVAPSGAQNVTSLALTVFGVRINEGSGLGSAIIAGSDGVQGSYAVGDEIQPGVTLKAVAFDHIIIDHGGAEEIVYLDQSSPVASVDPESGDKAGAPGTSASPSQLAGGLTVDAVKAGIGMAPRMNAGRVDGLIVSAKGPAFQAAGFRDGDVIVQVNGRAISGADDAANMLQSLQPGARISLTVERGASTVPVALLILDKK
jgi:general secretion pathway protein C